MISTSEDASISSFNACALTRALTRVFLPWLCVRPVSYTHLDVYKRQLQIGGSLGNLLGKIVHLDDEDRHVLIMCGMSAAFAALFGTPMAAAVFSMEMVSVGVMYYSALVPCVMSALIGRCV